MEKYGQRRVSLELMDRGYIINATILRDACIEKVESIQNKTLCQVFEEYIMDAKKSIGIEVLSEKFTTFVVTYLITRKV